MTFHRQLGNLPELQVFPTSFDVQEITTLGGDPLRLDGTFTLAWNASATTPPLPYDVSTQELKQALEAVLSTGALVEVTRLLVNDDNGQYRWRVTFFCVGHVDSLPLLVANATGLTGSDPSMHIVKLRNATSSLVGNGARVHVHESVAGRPHFRGTYVGDAVGSYAVAVRHLEQGGLLAQYFDNQWLLEAPVLERVDSSIAFQWDDGPVTPYGRDYVSVRWTGKLRTETSELYTLHLSVNDGARLWVDHRLIIDAWEDDATRDGSKHVQGEWSFTAGAFHDVRLEYKEEVGNASVTLAWSSASMPKHVIPASAFFVARHIVGSPFPVTVVPGAPVAAFSTAFGAGLSNAVAGQVAVFTIQARDAWGNDMADLGEEVPPFVVNVVGMFAQYSGLVVPAGRGLYNVSFTALKAGNYRVYIQLAGRDIQCGSVKDEEAACSPFDMTVVPGPIAAHMSEAEGDMVHAVAGEVSAFLIQARDAYGNRCEADKDSGFEVRLRNTVSALVQFSGAVQVDQSSGLYRVTYTIPEAGVYEVLVTYQGTAIQTCPHAHPPHLYERGYNGLELYRPPAFCSALEPWPRLEVVHGPLHAPSTTVVVHNDNEAVLGEPILLTIESRDAFGNLRVGNHAADNDGASDTFIVEMHGPSDNQTSETSSSAIQRLWSNDTIGQGRFRLGFGNESTPDLDPTISAAGLEVVLGLTLGLQGGVRVRAEEAGSNGLPYLITITSRLDEWQAHPLRLLPPSTGGLALAGTLALDKLAAGGMYVVHVTAWSTGMHILVVRSATTGIQVHGSPFLVNVAQGSLDLAASTVIMTTPAQVEAGTLVRWMFRPSTVRRAEVQAVWIQSPTEEGELTLSFKDATTVPLTWNASSADVTEALEALGTVGGVTVAREQYSGAAPAVLWMVTFDGHCQSATAWSKCPPTVGDLPLLLAESSLSVLTVNVQELVQGTSGSVHIPHDVETLSRTFNMSIVHASNPSIHVTPDQLSYEAQDGVFVIEATPEIQGHYHMALFIDDIQPNGDDLSQGLQVTPASVPAAPHSFHTARPQARAGVWEKFTIQAVDRFGNVLLEFLQGSNADATYLATLEQTVSVPETAPCGYGNDGSKLVTQTAKVTQVRDSGLFDVGFVHTRRHICLIVVATGAGRLERYLLPYG